MTRAALAITLIALAAAVLVTNTIGGPLAHAIARGLFVVLCLLGLCFGTLREVLLLGVALLFGGVLWWTPEGWVAVLKAMDLATYFAAFIALLTALKIAAERSQSVLAVGRYLIGQPAGRRYVATASGGHILA